MLQKRVLLTRVGLGAMIGSLSLGTALAQSQPLPNGQAAPPPTAEVTNDDEIIVTGTRSSIENSILSKQNADSIIDSLSADQADRFPDNNLGEALARIPGISFQRDNNTGDGEFISIRGLDAQYNTVLYDGLRTGTADEFRRQAFDVITGSGVSRIDVIKAPLPEHSSEGIGGVVNIRTRGALDRREAIGGTVELSNNSFADKDGYEFSGYAVRELSDTVGVYLNARYRKRYFNNFQFNPATTVPDLVRSVDLTGPNGTFTFDDPDELDLVPTDFIDIDVFNTEQINYTNDDIERDEYTLSGNIQWEATPTTTVILGGRHEDKRDHQDTNTIEFDVDNSFVDGVNTWRDPELAFRGAVEDDVETESRLFFVSETNLDKWDIDVSAGWSRAFRDRPIREIIFEQELEDVPSSPGTGADDERAITFAPFDFSQNGGLFPAPQPLNSTVFLEALNPFCVDEDGDSCGEIADLNYELEDSRENERYTARFDITRDFSDNGSPLQNIKFGAQFERSEFLDRDIDISTVDDSFGANGEFLGTDLNPNLPDSNVQITDFDLITDQIVSFDPVGNPFQDIGFLGIPKFDHTRLREVYDGFEQSFLSQGVDPRESDITSSTEDFYSAYFQTKFTFDRLDIVGGARIEYYEGDFAGSLLFDSEVEFTDQTDGQSDSLELTSPQAARNVTQTDNFEFLPRIALNYNLSDQAKLRASYTTAISRPTFDLLAGRIEGNFDVELRDDVALADATLDDVVDASSTFEIGNPNLKNAYSQNFDVSFEYYADGQNAFSAAVFYKEIDDFIFNSFATDANVNQGNISDPGAIFADLNFQGLAGFEVIEQLGGFGAIASLPFFANNVQQAQNGEKAEIYGIELGLFHTFDYLPGILSNLGIIANATFTDSKTDINLGTLDDEDALVVLGLAQDGDPLVQEFAFFNSPDEIYNATLFFDYEGLEMNLSYRNSGPQLEEIEAFGISQFQQGRTFVDLNVEYTFQDVGPLDRLTVYFEGSDLTDNGDEPSVFETRGRNSNLNDNSTFNGRTFTFGTRFRF